jgi:hypothetical protein
MSERDKDKYLNRACSDYTPTFTHDDTSWALESISSSEIQELKSEDYQVLCDSTRRDRTEPKGSRSPYRR